MDWNTLLSPAWMAVYLLIATLAVRRQASPPEVKRALLSYVLVSAVWQAIWYAGQAEWFPPLDQETLRWLWPQGALVLALLVLYLTMKFFGAGKYRRVILWAGGAYAGVLFLLGLVATPLAAQGVRLLEWVQGGITLGGLVMMGAAVGLTFRAYRQATQPLHRTRILSWSCALMLAAMGDLLLQTGQEAMVSLLHVLSALALAVILFPRKRLDLSQGILWGVYGLVMGGLGTAVIAFVIYQDLPFPVKSPLEEAVIKALGLGVVLNLALSWLSHWLRGRIFGAHFDENAVVREYAQAINGILDLPRLAQATAVQITRAFETSQVRLYVVVHSPAEACYYLTPVQQEAEEPLPARKIPVDSPLGRHLRTEGLPLAKYDVDFLPEFGAEADEVKEWLEACEVELLVPVHSNGLWVGLFMLGTKASGERYTPPDRDLLATLSEQTAVALQTARLFSDLKKVNEDLRSTQRALEAANQQLRQVDELKTAFIGVISHELRTPLANIAFSAQVLGMYGKEHFSTEEREQMAQLEQGVKLARAMVDNLITLASFLNEEIVLQPVTMDFREVLRDALQPLQQTAVSHTQKFQVDLMGDLFQVVGDRRLLKQAVHELTSNAIKYTPAKGEVWVTCWTSAQALCFDVRDTGVGIPEDKLDVVWNSFTQLQANSLQRGVEGLGLGLALVKYIVKAHGGFVWVESEQGKGSMFGFQVPLRGPAYPLDAATAPRRLV